MGKDPRAKKETHTYKYPEPLNEPFRDAEDPKASLEAREAMIDPEEAESGHWITLRIPRSKADVDAVADLTASRVIFGDNGDGAKFEQRLAHGNRGVFDLLVEDWSFDRDFGMKLNGAEFASLDIWAADWVTACIADAVAQGTSRDYAKKVSSSSNKPEASLTEPPSPEPAASA